MYICSSYEIQDEKFSVLIVSPHGSNGQAFFDRFPEIYQHEQVRKKRKLFERFVTLEQDVGASELAHQLGRTLMSKGISSVVLELDYPRSILDGGRIIDHCLRNSLPYDLSQKLEDSFRDIHRDSLEFLGTLHEAVNQRKGLVVDVHTMASFSPVHGGEVKTNPESFEDLEQYCEQFFNAPRERKNLRAFDVITEDGSGNMIADPILRESLIQELSTHKVAFEENNPYHAYPAFLMHTHLTACPAIALDVPKHMISDAPSAENFDIADFQLNHPKIDKMSQIIGSAVEKTLQRKKTNKKPAS